MKILLGNFLVWIFAFSMYSNFAIAQANVSDSINHVLSQLPDDRSRLEWCITQARKSPIPIAEHYIAKGKILAKKLEDRSALANILSETDLVLLDINLGGRFDGLEIAKVLKDTYHLPFIFITSYADEHTLNSSKVYHPSGYVVKPFEEPEVYAAIEVAWYNHQGKRGQSVDLSKINKQIHVPLIQKEFLILEDLIQGKPYLEIAQDHYISINTVNTHVKNIYAKLDVHSRAEAAQFVYGLR